MFEDFTCAPSMGALLGASEQVARRVAANSHCWWRNSDGEIKRVLTIAYFDKLGVPRLS
jgi:hypothetical protein